MERKLGCQPSGATVEQRIETLRLMKDVGFTYYFFGINNARKDEAEKLMNAAENIGLKLDEIHAPFKDINRVWYDDFHGDLITDMLLDSLSFCADHGVRAMVIHESASRVAPDMSNAGLARFRRIFEEGNAKGVKIAVENVRRTNYVARIFHENKDIPVYYCWDCGHENCYTPGVDHLALFGDKLACTHIHDNRGVYMDDDHILPFDGTTDWERKAELMKATGFDGPLSLELNRGAARYQDWSDEKYYKEAFARLDKFAKMCGK